MRRAKVFVKGTEAGTLIEMIKAKENIFQYNDNYTGPGISLTMPINQKVYTFKRFPAFFDGVLPEGVQLEGLLKIMKIDRNDSFSQLLAVGEDLIGVLTVREIIE
jgi:serine/threonine-protein kinase HipA